MIGQYQPDNDGPTFLDLVEVLRLPIASALITAAITWLIWYYTTVPCTPEVASITACNPAPAARYVNVDIFGRMLTYALLVGGIGGLWKYDMIKKERAARIAAEEKRAAAEGKWVAAESRLVEERAAAEKRLAEERAAAAENRLAAENRFAEERQAFLATLVEEREVTMTTINGLMAQMTQLLEQRNGNHGGNDDADATARR